MNRKILVVFIGITILLCVIFPNNVCQGANTGLTLWFHTVLPALLPFMILSTFMIRQNITGSVSRFIYPLFHRLFGLTKEGCYPAVMGLLSGYPVGAKTVAQLYQEQRIGKEEAQYLLCFCNNASPMFLLEYMAIGCMKMVHPIAMLVMMYLSGYFNALFFRKGKRFEEKARKGQCVVRKETMIVSLDESILDAFVTITKIGGYIILFSIFAQIIEDMLPISVIIKYIGIGVLEITTGGDIISNLKMASQVRNVVLTSLCAFGGFSSVAQTASVLSETDLSVGKYIVAKLCQTLIAAIIAILYFKVAHYN